MVSLETYFVTTIITGDLNDALQTDASAGYRCGYLPKGENYQVVLEAQAKRVVTLNIDRIYINDSMACTGEGF